MNKVYVHYDYGSYGSAECIGDYKGDILQYKSDELKCSRCGSDLMPFYNYCPKCGNVLPLGLLTCLFTCGEAFSDYRNFKSIKEDVKEIISKNNINDIILEKCVVLGKTYVQVENTIEKVHIYHITADVIENNNPEKYGVLLFDTPNDNKERYKDMSCAVKFTGHDNNYIEYCFNKILKECYEESK